ncbi:hypothetical protein [Amycolatopsis sp. NPDC004079]|uniref:hypothetical protein n=1 Tax=Amycolatopsis sp. NPDC004079 TaxID=3154549 RepID=UPI0033A2D581
MTDREHLMAAARAEADRQLALVDDTLDEAVDEARVLLATKGKTDAWALLGVSIARQAEPVTREHQLVVELLAAASIRLAQRA